MLVISGVIEVNPDGLEDAIQAITRMVEETVKEAGCQIYEFSQVLGAPNRFRIYEEWDDGATLAAHGASSHMAEFRAALGQVGIVTRDVFMIKGGEKKSLG